MPFDEESIAAPITGKTPEPISVPLTKVREVTMKFPVSIKGVLVEAGRVVLLEDERDE